MEAFSEGMRVIINDEEWEIRKIKHNDNGNSVMFCTGVSPGVYGRDVVYLTDPGEIRPVIKKKPERRMEIVRCPITELEAKSLTAYLEMKLIMDNSEEPGSGRLVKTKLLHAMCSCPSACVNEINIILRELHRNETIDAIRDMSRLEHLRDVLEHITPGRFSRFDYMEKLLKSPEYGWHAARDDRIMIFTERDESVRYIAKFLSVDFSLGDGGIIMISGDMGEEEKLRVSGDFGSGDSAARILIVKDSATAWEEFEKTASGRGYLNPGPYCHRIIHFDIPWSRTMIRHRNSMIDAYNPAKSADIRYMNTVSPMGRTGEILAELAEGERSAFLGAGIQSGGASIAQEIKETAARIELAEKDL